MNNEEIKAPFDVTIYPEETYTTSKGEEKTRRIVPDDVFEEHLKELPEGTVNESKSRRKAATGALNIFGANPESDREIQRQGAEALHAVRLQRRTFKEQADILLARIDKETGNTGIEDITIAMIERALAGDVKAYTALRDTAGEKPTEAIDLNANVITEADKALIEKLKNRLEGTGRATT